MFHYRFEAAFEAARPRPPQVRPRRGHRARRVLLQRRRPPQVPAREANHLPRRRRHPASSAARGRRVEVIAAITRQICRGRRRGRLCTDFKHLD